MSTKALMTVEQFAHMNTADTEDYELVEGELVSLSSGTPRHNTICDLIVVLLWMYFRENRTGKAISELDCRVGSDTVRRPDLAIFIGEERLRQIDRDKIPAPFAPDIAVEVLSPSERAIDVRRKVLDYLRGGSKEVWLVDHANREVLVHTNAGIRVLGAADVLESPLLPGFHATVTEIFANE